MARPTLDEVHVLIGDIQATSDKDRQAVVLYNSRADGAELEIAAARLTSTGRSVSATHYYTATLCNNAGSTIASVSLAAAATTTAPLTMGTITAANAKIASGETAYLKFTQTGNGQSFSTLGCHLRLKVNKAAS